MYYLGKKCKPNESTSDSEIWVNTIDFHSLAIVGIVPGNNLARTQRERVHNTNTYT